MKRQNQRKCINSEMCFMGFNAAGLSSKFASFNELLKTVKPTVFFAQETKLRTKGKISTEYSKNYQIYELNRKNKSGGGLAIGAIHGVGHVQISEGDDDVEILVTQLDLNGVLIR